MNRRHTPIIVGIAVVLLLGVCAGLSIRENTRRVQREQCANNLKQIGQAILLYSVDNRNRYPDSFSTLMRQPPRDRFGQSIGLGAFVCPASGGALPATADDADRGDYRLIDFTMPMQIDKAKYGYFRSGIANAEQCAAIEVPGHHAGGVHVLLADGQVEFRQISEARGTTWADTQDDVMRGRPIRWPASQPVR